MARKHESWLEIDFDARSLAKVFAEDLSNREVPIVTCSILDSVLADLIKTSLRKDHKEVDSFLGLSGDGRAPLGSFGARIQAAYLLQLIDKFELRILKLLKDIRNDFSHKVKVSFTDSLIKPKIVLLAQIVAEDGPKLRRPGLECSTREEFEGFLKKDNYSTDGCVGLFIGAACMMVQHLQEKIKKTIQT